MKRNTLSLFSMFVLLSFFVGCTVNNVKIDDKLENVFNAKGVEGTFGIFDNSRGKFTIYNLDRFKSPYSPGETFNIFNALVGMHTGKVADENEKINYRVEKESADTMTIGDAYKSYSTDHFKALANYIGKDTLQFWIDSVKYGNMKMGKAVDEFWSNGSILISADEQLGFIKHLYFKQLPFRASVQEKLKKLLIIENNSQFQLAYQLGTATDKNKLVYWVMGWIEENRHVYPFVLNFSIDKGSDAKQLSKDLTLDALKYLGFFKGKM